MLYSFGTLKNVTRGKGKSAVASAAYFAAIKLTNEYDGVVHDFSKKENVLGTFIRLPESAPTELKDESRSIEDRLNELWNLVEISEKNINGRLARTNYLPLQYELTLEQNIECVERFIKENCLSVGMGATYSIHNKGRNPHVDLMYLCREFDGKGGFKKKSQKVYLCRKGSEDRYMSASEFKDLKAEGWQKVYKYSKGSEKRNMTLSEASEIGSEWERINRDPISKKVTVSAWDAENLVEKWRESWERILNEKFEELGIEGRVSRLSYKDQGLKKIPTIHEGWGPGSAERKKHNAAVKMHNEQVAQLASRAIQIVQEMDYHLKGDNSDEYIKINFDDDAQIVEKVLASDLLEIHWEKAIRDKLEKCKKTVERKKDLEKINENYNELLRKESKSLEEKLGLIPTKSKGKEKELELEKER